MTHSSLYALCAAVFGAAGLLTFTDPGLHTALFLAVGTACAALAERERRMTARP